jgi:hypothetical protein
MGAKRTPGDAEAQRPEGDARVIERLRAEASRRPLDDATLDAAVRRAKGAVLPRR